MNKNGGWDDKRDDYILKFISYQMSIHQSLPYITIKLLFTIENARNINMPI